MRDHVTAQERLAGLRNRDPGERSWAPRLESLVIALLVVVLVLVFGLIDMRDQRDRALEQGHSSSQECARLQSRLRLIERDPPVAMCSEMGFGLGVFCLDHPVLVMKEGTL